MVSTESRKNLEKFFSKFNACVLCFIKHFYLLFDKSVSFLTQSSIFIALNCLFLLYFSFLLYDIADDLNVLLSSFFITFTVYSFDKLSNIKEDSISLPDRAGFIYTYRKIITVAIIASYISAFSLSVLKNPFALLVVHFPLFIGLIYSIKILNVRLKDITGIKNIVVALSWAVVGTSFPLAVHFRDFNQIIYVFYFIFIKFFINTTLFDVRDIKGDRINGVITIPVYLGLKKTKNLLLILNSTFIPWLLFSYLQGFFHKYFFVLIFTIFYGYFYILHFCGEGIEIGKSLDLLVDGEWILVVIVAMIFA